MSMSQQLLTEEENPKSQDSASEKELEVIVIHITNKAFTGSSISFHEVVRSKAERIAGALDSVYGTDTDAGRPRTRRITSGKTLSTISTSAKVDSRPSEKRASECANRLSTPSAAMTCEGSNDPAEQADPLDPLARQRKRSSTTKQE